MWTIRDWRGSVYPEKDPQRTWPEHYGRQFGTLEFNATHYRIHPADRMAEWAAAMPEGSRFAPSFPKSSPTSAASTTAADRPMTSSMDSWPSETNWGPRSFSFLPHFAPKHAAAMATYLEKWPRELRVAVEFRHPEWFEGGAQAEEMWARLQDLGMGSVISDTAGRRDALHMRVTAPFVLVRFGGYEGHASDEDSPNGPSPSGPSASPEWKDHAGLTSEPTCSSTNHE